MVFSKKKLLTGFLLTASLILLCDAPAEASYGISPADVTFDYLIPGITVEKDFLISKTETDKDVNVVVETEVEDADNWFTFDPGVRFSIPKSEKSINFKVKIKVPEEADYKKYQGFLNIKFMDSEGSAGVSVINGVGVGVNLTVTDKVVTKLLIRQVDVADITENNPLTISLTAENNGNTPVKPDKLDLNIFNMAGEQILKDEVSEFDEIRPGSRIEMDLTGSNTSLKPDEYKADVTVTFAGEEIFKSTNVFRVRKLEITQSSVRNPKETYSYKKDLIKIWYLSFLPIILIWIWVRKKVYS